MAETSLEPLDPYWPMVGDSCAKSGMETVGTASMVKTEANHCANPADTWGSIKDGGEEQVKREASLAKRQAMAMVKARMDTAKVEGTSQSSTSEKDEDAYDVPVKFEKPSETEMNHQGSDVVDTSRHVQKKAASTPVHFPPHSSSRATRRLTRKPQFTQRIWRLDIVGGAFDRWRRIGASKGLCSDTEIASFLMQHYEDTLSGVQSTMQCSSCHAPLALTCIKCHPVNHRTIVQPRTILQPRTLVQPRHVTVSPPPALTYSDDGADDDGDRMEESVIKDSDNDDDEKKDKDLRVPAKLTQRCKRRKRKRKLRQAPRAKLAKRQARREPPKLAAPSDGAAAVKSVSVKDEPSDSVPEFSSTPRRHICSECGATFTRAGGLKVHMRIHTGEKPYKCEDCGLAFNQTVSLIVHKRKHSGERPYACTECGATFPLASTLKQHARIHSGERPFSCTECQKTFSRSGDLTSHMRVHTGLKPFLCQDCGKRFASSSDLTKHKRTHTGDKPFECSECHKKFPFPHRLTAHMRSHTGDKPYLCTMCGAAFARASNLTVHFRIHTGDKPFECDECGKRFSDSGNLCKHRRTSHGGSGKKSDKVQFSDTPANANFPPGLDFPDLSPSNQLTLPHTVPPVSLPVFARSSALLASQGVRLGSEDSGSTLVGCNSLPTNYSSMNQAPSSLSVANTLAENRGAFSTTFDKGSDSEERNRSATPALGEEDKCSGLMFKCENCPASFADPGILAKHCQMLHSRIDQSFIAVGNVEQHRSPAVSFPDTRVGGGMGDEQTTALPYLSAAALSYYYQQ